MLIGGNPVLDWFSLQVCDIQRYVFARLKWRYRSLDAAGTAVITRFNH